MSRVNTTDNFSRIAKEIESSAKESFDTVATDLKRVSSGASPVDTGHLEKNHMNITYGSDVWEAVIYFDAFNGTFDYAKWTHDEHYNLGERSRKKAGGSSRFTGHVPVGRKYLQRTKEQGEGNYIRHIGESIQRAIR